MSIDPKLFLFNTYKNNRLSHAYLITGNTGEESNCLVSWFASLLLCKKGADQVENRDLINNGELHIEPCGSCNECKLIKTEGHPDHIIIRPENGSIKIAQTRQLKKDVVFCPARGNWRIIGILDAHTMTEEAAQSILKLLEEPPKYLVIFLTAIYPKTILPTILSRCQILPSPASTSQTDIEADETKKLIKKILPLVENWHEWGREEKLYKWHEAASAFEKEKKKEILDILSAWFWDLIRVISGASPLSIAIKPAVNGNSNLSMNSNLSITSINGNSNPDKNSQEQEEWLKSLETQACRIGAKEVLEAYYAVQEAKNNFEKHCQWRLILDLLFLKLENIMIQKRGLTKCQL